ncbi:hypothetical protein P152DRAFT_415167, partial [Eremomyces bilateralis CBS 781.70]
MDSIQGSSAVFVANGAPRSDDGTHGSVRQSVEDIGAMSLVIEPDWKPAYIRRLTNVDRDLIADIPFRNESFSEKFIHLMLRGKEVSPGMYLCDASGIIPTRFYYVFDAKVEPYLPKNPGTHGAKLSAFFNTDIYIVDNPYDNVALFIKQSDDLHYFGQYNQPRNSDRLGYDTQCERVPDHVKMYWAQKLADPHRAAWLKAEMMKHFCPEMRYNGRLPAGKTVTPGGTVLSEVDIEAEKERYWAKAKHELFNFARRVRSWKEEAEMEVFTTTVEKMLLAFEATDADETPALRLWWEYLVCTGWDAGVYQRLWDLK